jgi:hypothetical protein
VQIGLSRVAPCFDGHRWYSFWLLSLIGLTGGCAGWAGGIILSPIGSQASGAQKVLAAVGVFWTGVIAGHIPQISNTVHQWQIASLSSSTLIELLFGFGIFLFATCVTFNTRFAKPIPA